MRSFKEYKNRITYELGEMMGIGESPQLVPVEVVMIGSQTEAEYLGLYDLSETIKFEKSRLDLKTPDEDATQEEGSGNITGAYMISIYNWLQDNNDPSSNHFMTDTMNGLLGFMFREPEYASEDLTEAQKAQREYMQTYIRDLEALIMADDYIDEEQHRLIADRMVLTSTADYWWIQIFTKNTDSYATSSTNMYKLADNKLYWGRCGILTWDGRSKLRARSLIRRMPQGIGRSAFPGSINSERQIRILSSCSRTGGVKCSPSLEL